MRWNDLDTPAVFSADIVSTRHGYFRCCQVEFLQRLDTPDASPCKALDENGRAHVEWKSRSTRIRCTLLAFRSASCGV